MASGAEAVPQFVDISVNYLKNYILFRMISKEFQKRRQALMEQMEPDSLAILFATPPSIRNRDVTYFYRPDSDFYYLTGFKEPEAVAILTPGHTKAEYTLFCRKRDKKKELWEGPITGPQEAIEHYGADAAFPINELDKRVPKLLERMQRVYYAVGSNPALDQQMNTWLNNIRLKTRSGVQGPKEIRLLDQYLHEMRLKKSPTELATLRTAVTISAQAHRLVMQNCNPEMTEYSLEADFVHECIRQKAKHQAYSPIIAGGNNGCILHYEANSGILKDGELVLIDAGCEYDYYAADITRTFPINGHFSPPQRELYELVLEAQTEVLKKVKPNTSWRTLQQTAIRTITKGLIELKLLDGSTNTLSKLIKTKKYKKFYMHGIGHWLGLDVHDVGTYKIAKKWRALEPGMCFTVEPGIYISPDTPDIDKRWHGIGIRIEDDVVVTDKGCEVLSYQVPRTIDEIESLANS